MLLVDLPNEILLLIAEELETRDLNSFLKTNHFFRALLAPLLTRAMLDAKNDVLLWAADKGREQLARLLLSSGADANIQSKNDRPKPPLLLAALGGHVEVVRLLLENGAKIELGSFDTRVADNVLHMAVYVGCIPVVRLLLESGADVNCQKYIKGTALHIAAYYGYVEVVELLLGYGAAVDLPNRRNETALRVAMKRRLKNPYNEQAARVVKILEAAGAGTAPRSTGGLPRIS